MNKDLMPLIDIFNKPVPKNVVNRLNIAKTLITHGKKETLMAIVDYISQPEFSAEYSILVMSDIVLADESLCDTQAFAKWTKSLKAEDVGF